MALVCCTVSSFTFDRDRSRDRELIGESKGTISDEFIAFEDDVGEV